jgi:aminoglycoside phosphotransferase (APT) family kinase protein
VIGLGPLVGRGSRSRVHAFGRGAVIKVPEPGTPDAWILWEARYTEAVAAVGAPAPRLLAIEHFEGRPASVWERLEGDSVWDRVVARSASAASLGTLVADLQLALFKLVPPVTLPDQHDRLAGKIRMAAAAVDPSLAAALDMMPAGDRPPRMCHGDLHPSNVILTARGPMLVDWFDAARGDRISDIARSSLTLLADGSHTPSYLPGADIATLGRFTSAYLSRLQDRLGFDDALLERWQAVNAAARLSEGMSREPLLAVWRSLSARAATTPEAQSAAG